MRIDRRYTTAGQSPYAGDRLPQGDVSEIRNPDGSIVFRLEGIEVPEAWSQVASRHPRAEVFPQGRRARRA
jgi:ribonucleoside-diphosphate reductase alpha chain